VFGSNDLSGLGAQLAHYRMLDDWEEARRIKEDGRNAHNLTAMTINYDNLAGRYNDLVVRFNDLLDGSQKAARHADQLQDEVANRDREIADLNRRLAEAQAEIQEVKGLATRTVNYYSVQLNQAEDELKMLRSQQP
jgi:predicted RNase H-like nuclease (RuvC/YqgF family)